MSLNNLGFEVIKGYYPIDLVSSTFYELFNVFQIMSESKFGLVQQQFWLRKGDDADVINTLRINDVKKVLSGQIWETFVSLSTKLVNSLCDDGLDYEFLSSHSFYKSALVGKETPWHQDPAYSSKKFSFNNITCWIPLNPVNKESSCLQFVKGSHENKKLLPHVPISDISDCALEAILKDSEKSSVETVSVDPGDVILHRSYVVHRSTPNKMSNCRIALVLIFSAMG
jgi:hypothetical protein